MLKMVIYGIAMHVKEISYISGLTLQDQIPEKDFRILTVVFSVVAAKFFDLGCIWIVSEYALIRAAFQKMADHGVFIKEYIAALCVFIYCRKQSFFIFYGCCSLTAGMVQIVQRRKRRTYPADSAMLLKQRQYGSVQVSGCGSCIYIQNTDIKIFYYYFTVRQVRAQIVKKTPEENFAFVGESNSISIKASEKRYMYSFRSLGDLIGVCQTVVDHILQQFVV